MNSAGYPHWTVECGFGAALCQSIPDLRDDAIRTAEDVSGCEAEQPDTGQQQPILAPIVLNKAGSMRLAVVVNAQAVLAVVQVWTSKNGSGIVPNGDVHLRTGQATLDEQHTKPRFHGRFRGGLGQIKHKSFCTNTPSPGAPVDPLA